MIIKPVLPPRAGYVEIINENGEHVYKSVVKEQAAEVDTLKAEIAELNATVDTLIVDSLGGGDNV